MMHSSEDQLPEVIEKPVVRESQNSDKAGAQRKSERKVRESQSSIVVMASGSSVNCILLNKNVHLFFGARINLILR